MRSGCNSNRQEVKTKERVEEMDRNRILFCPDLATGLTTQVISDVLAAKVFGDKDFAKLLKARYDQMGELFRDAHYDDPRWDLKEPFSDCKNKADRDKKDARLVVPRSRLAHAPQNVTRLFDYDNFGHDMPVWVSYNNDPNAKRIMVVSQDPLRNDDLAGSLYLSTPFGVHSRDFENGVRNMDSRVRDMLDMFLAKDVCVYLTDYMKFFAVDKPFIRDCIDSWRYKGMFSRVLEAEVKKFNPDLIIILGGSALNNELTDTSLINIKPWNMGHDVQKVDFRIPDDNGVRKGQAVMAVLHPSNASYQTKKIKELIGNVEHPIIEYYKTVVHHACNYLLDVNQYLHGH